MLRIIAATAFTLAALSTAAAAQQPSEAERERIRREMMAAMAPGPEHDRLAGWAGDWNLEVRMWMSPGADPVTTTGTAQNRMILGGRFLESRSQAGTGDMGIESLVLLGFDRRHGQYTLVGFDTWGTYYVTAAGRPDGDGRVVMDGVNDDPISGVRETYQMILRPVDDDTFVHEVVFTDAAHTSDGEPFKLLEITYRRSASR